VFLCFLFFFGCGFCCVLCFGFGLGFVWLLLKFCNKWVCFCWLFGFGFVVCFGGFMWGFLGSIVFNSYCVVLFCLRLWVWLMLSLFRL
jgi:hypothetical protein